ncbi:hypothetical protein E2C01_038898 [Portunus trituberculatus]|uniref:Uncharacterized protein n=1 Tax=Portunus trituberculatus TaxID=210409 RepID=A0A5B7FID8_PORTR|nr:hypothetical protein [Portunus trituberculatus]
MKKTKEPSGGEDDSPAVVLRRPKVMSPPTKSAPVLSPYNFMRRSCTFVAESSLGLRKSASRTTSMDQSAGIRTSLKGPMIPTTAPQKVVKDRKNLALQVRQKKDMLEENANGENNVNGRMEQGVSSGGRMSRLVGGLRAWSSTEDVRQSFMGALGRTVSVIKQPRKAKQASAPNTRPSPSHPDSKAVPTRSNNIKTTSASTTTTTTTNNNYRATFNKSKSTRASDLKTEKQSAKRQTSKFQFGKTGEGKTKTSIPRSTPASDEPSSRSPNQANSR